MPSLADGKVKIPVAARNSLDRTDAKVIDFLTVKKSRAVESKIIFFEQSMLVNNRSLNSSASTMRFQVQIKRARSLFLNGWETTTPLQLSNSI